MTITIIPFILNHKPGTLQVRYKANSDAITSGFEIFAACGFDVERCIGYPTMHARLGSYEGAGYANACGWIQIVTRREYAAWEAAEPAAVVSSVDTHPMLEELGVPFLRLAFRLRFLMPRAII